MNTLYFLFDGPPRELRLREAVAMYGHGVDAGDHRLEQAFEEQQNERNWGRLRRFLTEDADALELVAVLEAGLAELSDPALAYGGLCPRTSARLDQFVARAIESARPLEPRVEVLFDEPPATGS